MAGTTIGRSPRASPAAAVILCSAGLALVAAWVPLTYLTGDLQPSRDGLAPVFALACGLLGALVARRQPRNPEGWLLLGLAVIVILLFDSGLYAVLDYRLRAGRLPLGESAVFIKDTMGELFVLVFALVIMLFPDGRLTRQWTWVLWSYLALVALLMLGMFANEAGTIIGRHIQVNVTGQYSSPGSPTGVLAALATVAGFGWILTLPFWPAFVARQFLSWRRSSSEHRQQLKWLMGGAVIALAGLAVISFGPPKDQMTGRVAADFAILAQCGRNCFMSYTERSNPATSRYGSRPTSSLDRSGQGGHRRAVLWRQPRNPEGQLLLGLAVIVILQSGMG